MKNLKSIIVYLSVLVLLGVMVTGCGGKSDEEKLEELNEKMENAESFEEIEAISKKIDKLEEKIRSNVKTTKVELGKPITYWQKDDDGPVKRISEFQITFKDPVIDNFNPYEPKFMEFFKGQKTPVQRTPAEKGMKYFGIKAEIKNLGPRACSLRYKIEVKVNPTFSLGG